MYFYAIATTCVSCYRQLATYVRLCVQSFYGVNKVYHNYNKKFWCGTIFGAW